MARKLAIKTGKRNTSVPLPAVKPPPAVKSKRVYTKGAAQKDPADFSNFGFGQTGLTGRS